MALFVLRSSMRRSLIQNCLQQQCRMASDLPAPPLLLKFRGDMKQAMKDKDTARLAVLRGVLAEVTNAAKTSNPLQTDMQLLSLLRKRVQASKAAVAEFQNANRSDLVEKENAQQAVLEEYAASVETVGEDEIRHTVESVMNDMSKEGKTINLGTILKEVFQKGGPLDNKPVDRGQVAEVVKRLL